MKPPPSRWIALLLITALALYLTWLVIQPFVIVILWAVVLTIVAQRPYRWLRSRGSGPNVSAMLATVIMVLCVIIPVAVIGFGVAQQVTEIVPEIQNQVGKLFGPEAQVRKWLGQQSLAQRYLNGEDLRKYVEQFSSVLTGWAVVVAGGVLSTVVQFVLVLFAMYYLLRDSDTIVDGARRLLPLDPQQFDRLLSRTHEIIAASLRGVLLIAALQGLLGGLAFWMLGIKGALFWGVVMFLLSMIPLVGAFVIWLPVAAYLAINGEWTKAIILSIWGAAVIGSIDNFLRPVLVGQRTKLHELTVFFSVLGGLQVFGMLGLIVGPVVVAVAVALLDMFRALDEQRTDTDPSPTPAPPAPTPAAIAPPPPPPPPPQPKPHSPKKKRRR